MLRTRQRSLVGLAVAAAAVVIFPYAFTVVPIEEQEQAEQSDQFDAGVYVDERWAEITSTIREQAVDIDVILAGFEPDENGIADKEQMVQVAEEHGLITDGEAHVYAVRTTGEVVSADTESSLGTVQIAVDDYSGPVIVNMLVGPRLPSDDSSIRDAVGFISFGDFRDQTEYGRVASEINGRVSSEVLADVDAQGLVGQRVDAYGAFTIRTFNLITIDVSEVTFVPIAIETE